ncbi:unnamed protein product [Adineta ricciae]|uniref:Uncharacterized protein n=1 Tax=Adineta ricciae TaxID=249248 RepID=A0A815QIY4_ADIRI|nr:unnamed protein product [Adineta ricciae]
MILIDRVDDDHGSHHDEIGHDLGRTGDHDHIYDDDLDHDVDRGVSYDHAHHRSDDVSHPLYIGSTMTSM